MHEALRRLLLLINWLAALWIAAWLIAALNSDRDSTIYGLMTVPGLLALALAWVLRGFLKRQV
jgi:hypothetical protein